MKYFLIVLMLMLEGSPVVIAQPNPQQKEAREQKIQALYIAYVTKELNLTENEAQKFWPVHSQYDTELKALKLDAPELDRQQSILNVKKKYEDKFISVLGNERTNTFFRKDAEFRKKLVERVMEARRKNGQRPRP